MMYNIKYVCISVANPGIPLFKPLLPPPPTYGVPRISHVILSTSLVCTSSKRLWRPSHTSCCYSKPSYMTPRSRGLDRYKLSKVKIHHLSQMNITRFDHQKVTANAGFRTQCAYSKSPISTRLSKNNPYGFHHVDGGKTYDGSLGATVHT